MIRVGIIGSTGYAGIGIVSLFQRHPEAEIMWVTSESYAGKKISEVYPFLRGKTDLVCERLRVARQAKDVDLVFISTPSGVSMKLAPQFLDRGVRVIDVGSDYRFRKVADYKKWYGKKHTKPFWASRAIYGLPELYKRRIASARLVSNPGCYATAGVLALAPLAKEKWIVGDPIIDAKSGVSGAGRSLTLATHFTEADSGVSAYSVTFHRHTGEMEQELSELSGRKIRLAFTPHLIPMTRGILATCYVRIRKPIPLPSIVAMYNAFYERANFVRVQKGEGRPSTKSTFGTNLCDIHIYNDKHTGQLIIVSTLDNLVKGAAGQAIQNMNIMFGMDERTGLELPGFYP